MPGNTGTGFMYNTSVWTPTLGNHRDGLYASVWIPTLGSRVARGAWLSFFRMFRIEPSMLMFIDCFYLCFRFSRLDLQFWNVWKHACMCSMEALCIACIFWCFPQSSAVALKNSKFETTYLDLVLEEKTCTVHCIKTSFCLLFSCYYGLWQQIICSALQPNLILCWPGLRPH